MPPSVQSTPWRLGDPVARPTRDWVTAAWDLRRFGYCVLHDALGPDRLASLRARFVEQAEAELEAGIAFEDAGSRPRRYDEHGRYRVTEFTAANGGVSQRMCMLVNKGRVFKT